MNELHDLINEAVITFVGLTATYALTMASIWFKKNIISQVRQADAEAAAGLERAFDNAIAKAQGFADSVDLDMVIEYVSEFNPEDLKRFNLSGDRLVERAKAAIANHKPAIKPVVEVN